MTQDIQKEAPSNESRPTDVFQQVFGPEKPGRVRCIGRGPTPSKFFSNLESSLPNSEIIAMKARMKDMEEKLQIVTDALYTLAGSRSHFQVMYNCSVI